MKMVLVLIMILALSLTPIASMADTADMERRIERLEQLVQELMDRIEALESGSPLAEETSESDKYIVEITKVMIFERGSTINVEATIFNKSSEQSIDSYTLLASAYDANDDLIKFRGNDVIEMKSTETIKPGKTSPSGYRWSLSNMGETKTMMVAISKYHTTDGQTVEVPEDQLIWVEGLR